MTEKIESNDNMSPPSKGKNKFKNGDMLKFVRVRFPGNVRPHSFLAGKRKLTYGQKVLAMSDRGMAVGYINSFPFELPFKKEMLPLKSISKVASDEEMDSEKANLEKENEAKKFCRDLIEQLNIDMVITHVEMIQFGKKIVFYFNAPTRVDFRELLKGLVNKLKIRVELRQISIRERAAAMGGLGPCGLQTCCSYFLKNYGSVSIKMVKNQNLALIPSKINGACGQLKCCIKYENETYKQKKMILPKEGSFIQALNGDCGKILKLNILAETFEMLTDQGVIKKYLANQYVDEKKSAPPESWSFPENFDIIHDENSKIIGLEDREIAPPPTENLSQRVEKVIDSEPPKDLKKKRFRRRRKKTSH
jgi:cell fate regulator YaaT (PSP1 superfamily)